MTGPGAGSASRMRIAGIVLLAVAAVAAVVGLVALGSQGPSSRATAFPTTSTPVPPSTSAPLPGSVPTSSVAPPPTTTTPPATTPAAGGPVVAAPIVPSPEPAGGGSGDGSGGSADGSGGSGAAPVTAVPVRVLNNSLIKGLAEQAAGQLRLRGWNVVEVGNYPDGIIPVSTVYYRPGTDEQAAAQALADQFGIRSDVRFPGIANASPGLIVIATNNWGTTAPKS